MHPWTVLVRVNGLLYWVLCYTTYKVTVLGQALISMFIGLQFEKWSFKTRFRHWDLKQNVPSIITLQDRNAGHLMRSIRDILYRCVRVLFYLSMSVCFGAFSQKSSNWIWSKTRLGGDDINCRHLNRIYIYIYTYICIYYMKRFKVTQKHASTSLCFSYVLVKIHPRYCKDN